MFSEAHDDLYQFGFESHRWFPMALRKPKLLKRDAAPDATCAAAEAPGAAAASAAPAGGPGGSTEGVSGAATAAAPPHLSCTLRACSW